MGYFVISLDFELFWGIRDKLNKLSYGEEISKVWEVLPAILQLFEKYNVNVTFATVGFLFASNLAELENYLPQKKPNYKNSILSPYYDLFHPRFNDEFYFAKKLISLIKSYSNHEIATHTFSHYYCLEDGQNIETFEEDIKAAINIAKANNIEISSIIFPRNQVNQDYLKVCYELGIKSYRGNEENWYNSAEKEEDELLFKRLFRFLDSYFNISGNNCYSTDNIKSSIPYNIPASRFLRPYLNRLKYFEYLKIMRIKKSMLFAAKKDKVFHLWFHPHNFINNQGKNLKNLEEILKTYKNLNYKYNFESISMKELSNKFIDMK